MKTIITITPCILAFAVAGSAAIPVVDAPLFALTVSRTEQEATLKRVMERRQQLRDAARQTLEAIRVATTLTEVQKLQGVLAAQHLELDANDRDLFFAAQKTELQDIDNRNNKE